jgi:hypothetical protein
MIFDFLFGSLEEHETITTVPLTVEAKILRSKTK